MELKEYSVSISEDAIAMLDRHARFLANVSQAAARKTVDEILNAIESLSALPERFPFYENPFIPDNTYRRMLSAKRYLVIFEILGDAVFVDYILDCRQENKEF